MDLSVYKRPKKPLTCKKLDFDIPDPMLTMNCEKPKLLTVDSSTECHTTPDPVAQYMAECLEFDSQHTICEPHTGTGQLVNALINEGANIEQIKAFELNIQLCKYAKERFNNLCLEQGDFLHVKASFDRIICNPPFKTIIKHMDHVLKCLNTNGVAICLVPVTYKKISHEVLDILPDDTFFNCSVNTKVIRVSK